MTFIRNLEMEWDLHVFKESLSCRTSLQAVSGRWWVEAIADKLKEAGYEGASSYLFNCTPEEEEEEDD